MTAVIVCCTLSFPSCLSHEMSVWFGKWVLRQHKTIMWLKLGLWFGDLALPGGEVWAHVFCQGPPNPTVISVICSGVIFLNVQCSLSACDVDRCLPSAGSWSLMMMGCQKWRCTGTKSWASPRAMAWSPTWRNHRCVSHTCAKLWSCTVSFRLGFFP